MNRKIPVPAFLPKLRIALHFLLGITLLNYVAQIPYYIHFYGFHHVPNLLGVGVFLIATLALFLIGYFLTLQTKKVGGWLLLAFLVLEFVGYLVHNLAGAFLKDLPTNDLLFFTVSLIGYFNFAVSFVYIVIITKYRHFFLFSQPQALSENGAVAGVHSGTLD